jgi:hypothetical protein
MPPSTPQKNTDYSATPLSRKLGILPPASKAQDTTPREISLLAIPEDFEKLLGDLPPHITFSPRLSKKTSLALCFVRKPFDLDAIVHLLATKLPQDASAWIIHPKAHHKPRFHQNDVRTSALACGLVDYKVCSVTADWSGLKFTHRKP